MFTGIIEEIGSVAAVDELGGGRELRIRADMAPELRVDQSVSVSGACQTVVARNDESFTVVAIEETLRKTTLGTLEAGAKVNLERALQPTGRLDGHLVQGHVDGVGEVVDIEDEETDRLVRIRFEASFAPFLIPAGSVAVDGVSLTVARLEEEAFTVALIPHTRERTTTDSWTPGSHVNLEFDLLGKYVARQAALQQAAS